MTVIYKYEVPFPEGVVKLPREARILSVQVQQGRLCMWVEVQPEAPLVDHYFMSVGTGVALEPLVQSGARLKYITTWQAGPFVWHLHEVIFAPMHRYVHKGSESGERTYDKFCPACAVREVKS